MQIHRVCAAGIVLFFLMSGCRTNEPYSPSNKPEAGISLTLATERAESIRDVRYNLTFTIPAQASQPILGRETVRFTLSDVSHPVVLDFEPGANSIDSVAAHGRPIAVDV